MPAHLNRKQQREIKAVVERAKKDNGIPQTAQQSIPFQRMFPDGICRVTDNYYTKTIQYQDINYQLAQQEDKTAIFDEWCSFLNFFDSSIHFELSFMNMGTDAESFEKSVRIPFQKDEFNPVRAEYSQMLKKQLSQGNNGLTKTKYLTFGIEAESMRQAKPRLAHIENDLLNNFRRLGVVATPMDGKERLRLMHAMFHMGDDDKFFFDWKWLVESGLSVKDFIAPTAFAFKNNRTFQMGSLYGSMSFLSISASDLSDRMLADFLDMESSQIVTIHIQSVDQTAAIKTIKRTITELDRSKIEEQKKAVRSGYDMDIIPSDLATYGRDAKALLKELQSQNERMFMVTFLVMNTGRTEQELENNVFQAQSIAQKHNCNLRRLDFQQEQGLMSSLPLAQNLIEIRRGSHKTALLWVLAIGLLFMVISGMFSACSTMFQGGTQVVLGTSFTAEDEDILGTDEDYTALENDLRSQVDNIESTHPGYDEYRYALDEIGHNPYELAAYLTVVFEDYTREEVQAELVRLFEEQYDLELDEEVEIRSYTTTDEDGNTSTVYYEYRILNVTLTNYGLGNVIASSRLTAEQWERYKVLLETLGNRSYLFGEDVSSAPGGGGEYTDYDIPGEALTDTAFANMVREAEKYLGYPYVWGGSSPSTSFDCSGFVSWVINNCGNGWSVGRQTANGLKNLCDIIPPSEAKPGDLIFFQGTYNTSGASHVGIYVGNGMMIHCGDPISYASIETNYWQQHFYCFGRIP